MAKYYLSLALLILISSVSTHGQTSTFTYQGRLTDTSMPATGTYQMQFALYDAASGGTQIGSTIENAAVAVSNGVFTVQLDYGPTAFPGAERYLEISVRRSSAEVYSVLNPRQRVTSGPYAVRAANAGTADNAASLGGIPAGNYVQTNDPRLTDARTPTAGSGNYIQNQNGDNQTGNFQISGTGTANILDAATQFNISGTRALSVAGFNNLFVGIDSGLSNSTGDSNAFVGASAGRLNTIGFNNAFLGNRAGSSNTTGSYNAFVGSYAGHLNTGRDNVFIGAEAGSLNTTGSNNAFVGSFAGGSNQTGAHNTLIGAAAGVGANNLTYATALGAGSIVSSSNTVVLGRSGGQDAVLIPGAARVGASNASACALLISDDICFFDEQNSTLAVRNFLGTAYAPVRASGFVTASSIGFKKNVTQLRRSEYDSMLDRLVSLPLFTYRYRNESATDPLHTGLIAERSPASLLSTDGKAVDLYNFISLNAGATKALAARVATLSFENESQKQQIDRQQQQLNQQKTMILGLRKLVCQQNPRAEVCREEK